MIAHNDFCKHTGIKALHKRGVNVVTVDNKLLSTVDHTATYADFFSFILIEAGQADYLVLLAHLGQSWSAVNWRSDTVVAKTNGIDAVIDAHTHQLYVQGVQNKDGQEVPVVQAGCKFLAFSRLEIDPAARTATASVVATGVSASLVGSWNDEEDRKSVV